ncbi:MAG: DUF4388 domain-containing protein [Candidatus Aminicenantes bacterium]|nr:DUF4388 domain-containing protein [Candidatus Aminicenantes bacterium]
MVNILSELCRSQKGRIEGVSMADMLQLIWLEKMSCQLLVRCDGKSGTLNILDGELKNAKTQSKNGQEAALEILLWKNVIIELDNTAVPENGKLQISTEEMLLENIRRGEDKKKDTPKFRSLKSIGDKNGLDKEVRMNVSKLNRSVDTLKENLGGALLATDIWSNIDMQSLAGWNTQPAATALFGQITQSINQALEGSGFPSLGKYLIFDLVDGKLILIIPMGDFAWGMLVDGKKTQLGLLLNVALPKAIAAFEEAITSN